MLYEVITIGWLALQLINNHGGSAYFPIRLVREHLKSERLFLVEDSPLITLPVYMVYPLDRTESYMATALEGLRQLGAEEEQRQSLKPSTAAVVGDRQDLS